MRNACFCELGGYEPTECASASKWKFHSETSCIDCSRLAAELEETMAALAATSLNGVKIYNLASGKTLPQWIAEKTKKALSKDEGTTNHAL